MNEKRPISLYCLAAAFVLAFAVFLAPVEHADAHCAGKHTGNHPHCQGGGDDPDPNAEVPLRTTFDCPVIGSDHASCPDPAFSNRIQADVADSPYENDVDNVLNRIETSGRFALSNLARKNKPKPRYVWWDVTHVNGGIYLPNGDFLFTTTDATIAQGYSGKTVIHVGSQYTGQGGDLRAMQPGETITVDLWADVLFNTGKGGDGVFVHFDPYGDNCGRITAGAQVTRTDDGSGKRQWTIDVAEGAPACVLTYSDDLGDYVFGPFTMIADEL